MQIPKAIRNSLIIGGIACFSSLTATGTPSLTNLYAAAIAMGLAFFVECAAQYGVKPSKTNKKGQAGFFF